MNPYLEQSDVWPDIHQSFLIHARDSLSTQVGPNYLVKVEVRLILHERSAEERRFVGIADVGVAQTHERPTGPATHTLEAPVLLQLPAVEVEKHLSLEIHYRRNRRLVTVLELLSPANKVPGPHRDDYRANRRQVLAKQTNLVEIDLRRSGRRPSPPELPACDYYALVSRYEDRPRVGFWPIGLRDPLPNLPIPLAENDPPVHLDLKAVLDRTYDQADYGKYIYQETPEPPLSADDEAWARASCWHGRTARLSVAIRQARRYGGPSLTLPARTDPHAAPGAACPTYTSGR
jgi:hypothetical protein